MNYIKIISSIIIAVPPSQLPDDVKKRLAEKAKSLPGYKTKMCNNFVESEGHCQYDEMCHYAHGEEELREESNSGIAYQPIKYFHGIDYTDFVPIQPNLYYINKIFRTYVTDWFALKTALHCWLR